MSMIVLTAADAGEVLTLQRAAYVTEARAHGDLALPPLTQPLADLEAELRDPDVRAHGYRDDAGRLVAAVRIRVDAAAGAAYVGRLTVVPDLQGQGLGSGLLTEAEASLPGEITQVRLFTGERSAGNLRLYARLGYDESHREATPAGYDLVHMVKHRPAAPANST